MTTDACRYESMSRHAREGIYIYIIHIHNLYIYMIYTL